MTTKNVTISLEPQEINELTMLVEDRDKEEALNFCKHLKKKIVRIRSGMRSVHQRGGHIGPANLR
ncbi:hypothetical protein KKH56_06300 [bacterium]|nr:hypothetical protein [bacterium]